jgi:hypothetical protein
MEPNTPDANSGRHFLVELDAENGAWADVAEIAGRARHSAAQARAHGIDVRFVRSIYAPESNALFLVYWAANAEIARGAAQDADLRLAAVTAALSPRDGGSR